MICISTSARLANQLCLSRSLNGLCINDIKNVNLMIISLMKILRESGEVVENDDIVFVSGVMDD